MKTALDFSTRVLVRSLFVAFSSFTLTAAAADVSDIELRRLFEPSTNDIVSEAKGRIYIYEGLRDTDIDRAMDEQFDRLETMMFIRIIKTDESGEVQRNPDTGEVVTSDDGC